MGKRKIKVNLDSLMQKVITEKPITFGEMVDLHQQFVADKSLENLANRTIKDYKTSFKYFKIFLENEYRTFVDRDIDISKIEINRKTMKDYMSYMLHYKEYAPTTVNVRVKSLSVYLKWLYMNNYTSHNLALGLNTVKAPLDTIKPLDDRIIKLLLNGCDLGVYTGFRDFCTIVLVLDCGIRGVELVELMEDDLDFKNKLIKVRAEVSKTRTERFLPISTKTAKLLKELIDINKFNGINNNYIFQSTYGGFINAGAINLSLLRLKEKFNIKQRVTLYVLRHTFATNSIKNGMDVFTLQRIMGHSVLQTTRRYIQLDTKDLQAKHKQYSRIDSYLTKENGGVK